MVTDNGEISDWEMGIVEIEKGKLRVEE